MDGYPERKVLPSMHLEHQMLSDVFPADGAAAMLRAAREAARVVLETLEAGEASICCYEAVQVANAGARRGA